MIRLILARHGNTFEMGQTPIQVGARTDLPLTQQGRDQAEQIANFLHRQGIKPAAIFAGALKRQTESAQIIGKQLGIQIELNQEALTEIDYGPWEGLTSEEIVKQWPHEYARWTEEGRWAEKDLWWLQGKPSGENRSLARLSAEEILLWRNHCRHH